MLCTLHQLIGISLGPRTPVRKRAFGFGLFIPSTPKESSINRKTPTLAGEAQTPKA